MSQMKSVKRTITRDEFMGAIEGDSEFSIMADGRAFTVVRWSNGIDHAVFNYTQGEIAVGSPSAGALAKMQYLADTFQAEIVGNEGVAPAGDDEDSTTSTWIGWPIMVVTLLILLVWRW